MDQRRDAKHDKGGLLPLAALAAALLIGGLGAAVPTPATEGARPSRSRLVDLSLSIQEIRTTPGPGSRARIPAMLPPETPDAAHSRRAGARRE